MTNTTKSMAIFVLTGRGIETMVAEGGSQAWVINSKKINDYEYVVCIQNHKQDYFDPKQLSAPHHMAFFVGKLASITAADSYSDEKGTRKKLVFSEYAKIEMPDKWPGYRNPVFYGDLESFGIDVATLDFQPMPIQKTSTEKIEKKHSLTIAQAKAGLALHFGVTDADIEIVIRG